MTLIEAIELVLELARQNALDPETCDNELRGEAMRQREACNTLEDFAVNQLGDD